MIDCTNELVKQYKPLINKITFQFYNRIKMISWEDTLSMAYEGFALAAKNYDETRSKLTFGQYAAWCMRNNILTSIDNELRTVKLSNYAQKRATKLGHNTYNTISITNIEGKDSTWLNHSREYIFGLYEEQSETDEDVNMLILPFIKRKFGEKQCDIFEKYFGLGKYYDSNISVKDIANSYGCTSGYISQQIKRMTNAIQNNSKLIDQIS